MQFQSLLKASDLLDVLERSTEGVRDLQHTLQHVTQVAQEFFRAENCILFTINPVTNQFTESVTVSGTLLTSHESLYRRLGPDGLAQRVLKEAIIAFSFDQLEEPQSILASLGDVRFCVALSLYTKYHQKLFGVLYINFKDPISLDDYNYGILQLFTNQASFMLQEVWLLQRYQKVAAIGQEINHELSTVPLLFQHLKERICDILDTRCAFYLAIYQPQTNEIDLYMQDEGEFLNQEHVLLEGACAHVIATQETLFIKRLSKEYEHLSFQHVSISTKSGPKESLIFVPLVFRDQALGVLSVQHNLPDMYDSEDLSILQLLANHIALALYNMRLYHNLNLLNETGQLLTEHIDSEQVLQVTTDKIREATRADVVILYPYSAAKKCFMGPPRIAGELYASSLEMMYPSRPDDLAVLTLHHANPIFAQDSFTMRAALYDSNDHAPVQGNFQEREAVCSTAALPLYVGDVPVGVLFLNFRHNQHFDISQRLLIEGLAHYTAIAIKNVQEYGHLIQRRINELEILQYIDRELARNLDLHSVLDTLLRLAYEHVSAETCSIMLPNMRTQMLETTVALGKNAQTRLQATLSLKEPKGITRWVLEHKRVARVDDVTDPPWRDIYFSVESDIHSELDVPLLDGQEIVGILNFESTSAFRQEDEDFLLTLAGQGVLAIKNAQAYEREKVLFAEAQALNEISKEMISQLDHNRIFRLILEKALTLTNSTLGNLMLYDEEHNDLWMAAENGVAEDKKNHRHALNEGIVGRVATLKKPLNVDLSEPPWNEIFLEFFPGAHSELAVPMLAGGELRGVLNVESFTPHQFTEGDVRLMEGLAGLAVIALQNAERFDREKRLADEAQVLNEISKEMISELDHNRIINLILEKALELTHSGYGDLLLYDPERKDLLIAHEIGRNLNLGKSRQGLDQGIVGYVATHKQLVNANLSQSPWDTLYTPFFLGARSELAVPMLAGDELRGVLNVESTDEEKFDESDERLMRGLADLATIALQNAQAHEREKRFADEARVLNEISKEITGQLDLVHVLELILEKALELTRSTSGTFELYDPDRQQLTMVADRGVVHTQKSRQLNLDQGVVGYAARHQRLLNIDPSQAPWNDIYLDYIPGTRSELVVPILSTDGLRGVINIESPIPDQFNDSDMRLLGSLADLAVVALQNAQQYKDARESAQRFELLYRAGKELGELSESSQLSQAHEAICVIMKQQSESEVLLYRFDDENQKLELVYTSNDPHDLPAYLLRWHAYRTNLHEQARQVQHMLFIEDMWQLFAEDTTDIAREDTCSCVVVPIKFRDHYYGNLELSHTAKGHFLRRNILFFEALVQQLAGTIYRLEIAEERQELEQRSIAEDEMSSIGQSAFEITHRLGNDLGLVGSYVDDIESELVKLGVSNSLISRKLRNIAKAARTVLDLSGNLKEELARFGLAEKSAGEPVVISAQALFAQAQEALSLPASIAMTFEIDEDTGFIRVSPQLVMDILRNLVNNAVDAMPGGGKITLRAHNLGRTVVLEVADTGVGIPPDKKSKIFDLFFSTKRSSGFGLWSARRYALRNHGNLRVESTPGQGTTFILSLPRVSPDGERNI